MSDYAINLLKAIESGDQDQMNAAFDDAMTNKISDALDAKKIEVAQNIYGGGLDTSEDDSNISDEEEISTSEENESEEV